MFLCSLYIVRKYIIYLYKLLKQVENQSFFNLFWSVSQELKIKFIVIDHVHILYLSCNVKKSKITAKFY